MMQYYADRQTYTFDVAYAEETRCGTMWRGKCRENGKQAWLDGGGIQFDGERRFEAHKLAETRPSIGCQMWGGKIRDALPHGARYYMPK